MISAAHPGGRYFYLCVIANQNSCHCEPVTDVTGVAIPRIFLHTHRRGGALPLPQCYPLYRGAVIPWHNGRVTDPPLQWRGRNVTIFSLDELPPISNLSPFLFRQPEGDFSPPASLPLSSPLVKGGHGCGNPRILYRTNRPLRGAVSPKIEETDGFCPGKSHKFPRGGYCVSNQTMVK